MASKVNTKFVLIVVLFIGAMATIIGGLYVMRLRHDAGRSARIAEEAYKAGDLKRAYDYWGRAVNKEPGNDQYLKSLEMVLLQLKPKTLVEAGELYQSRLGILRHDVTHNPTSADAHLRLLHEIFVGARIVNGKDWWEMLKTAGDDMWQQLPESDPQRVMGKVYRAIGLFHLGTFSSNEELAQGLGDVQDAIKSHPKDDLCWSTFVLGHLATVEKMRSDGRVASALADQEKIVDSAMRDAIAAVPDGPETARINLLYWMRRMPSDLAAPPTDESKAVAENVKGAAQHLMGLLGPSSDTGLITDSADLVGQVPVDGIASAVDLLERYLAGNPDALDKRLGLAKLRYYTNDLTAAQDAAQKVLGSETLSVSFLSKLQFEMKRQAAALLVDIENRRWDMSPAAERDARLKQMEAARATLAENVSDPVNDPLMLKADGKIAFAKGDINKAAAIFDRLVRDTGEGDPEVLMYSGICLERVNQPGVAYERIMQALSRVDMRQVPVVLVLAKARIEANMNRYDQAAETLSILPPEAQTTDEVVRIKLKIANREGELGPDVAPGSDPVVTAISKANAAMLKNEMDSARGLLNEALATAPENLQLLQAIAALEIRAGQPAKAMPFIERGLAKWPDDMGLKRLQALQKFEDPLEAMREFHKTAYSNDKDRAVSMLISSSTMVGQQEALATKLTAAGKTAEAAKARDLADRAKTEAAAVASVLEAMDPNSPQVLEYRFNAAMVAKDWPAAEQALARLKTSNLDQADGLFFKGRYEIVRGNYQDAVRSLEAATDRVRYNSAAWRALGYAYQSLGNFTQAERAYEQATKCNPNDLDSLRSYLTMLSRRGDQTRMMEMLQVANRLAPQDPTFREMRLQLQADRGDKVAAFLERQTIYVLSPEDRANAIGLARMLSELQPSRELIMDEHGVPVFNANRWVTMSATERENAIASTKSAWNQQADEILNKLMAGDKDPLLVALKANLMRKRGQIAEGEKLLQEYVAKNTDPASGTTMLIELARYQVQSSHYTEAFATLEDAVKRQDPKLREGDQEMARVRMQLGQYELALPHLQSLVSATSSPVAQKQVVECLIKLHRFDEADKLLQELTKSGSTDDVVALLSAGIAEGRGDELLAEGDTPGAEKMYEAQREALAKAEALQPGSPTPRLLLAQSLVKEFRRTGRPVLLDDALEALSRAEKIRAGTQEISMVRVQVLKEKCGANPETAKLRQRIDQPGLSDAEKADARTALLQIFTPSLNELRRLLDRTPENVAVRQELMQTLLDIRDIDGALAVLDAGIAINPTVALWHDDKGDIYKFIRRDATNAAAAYLKSDDLAHSVPTLLKYVDAAFNTPKPDCKAIGERLAARQDDVKTAPELREFYARALACQNRKEEALAEMKLAYARRKELVAANKRRAAEISAWFNTMHYVVAIDDPAQVEKIVMELAAQKPDLYDKRGLAQTWLLSGEPGQSHALELQRQAIQNCPPADTGLLSDLNLELANYLLLVRDFQGASAAYEAVLKLQPENVSALNNLSFLLAEDMHDPAKAMPFIDQAMKLSPLDASVLDTAGWVHYRSGNLDTARKHLLESVRIQPTAGTYVHLAEVQFKLGDRTAALESLKEAGKLRPDPGTQQQIDALKTDISKSNPQKPGG